MEEGECDLALSAWFIVFPMIGMTLAILAGGGGLQNNQANPANGATTLCVNTPNSNAGGLTCLAKANSVTYFCNAVQTTCTLPYNCPGTVPGNTFCVNTTWVLTAGSTLVIPVSYLNTLSRTGTNQAGGAVVFGAIGSDGFVVMIVTASTIVAIGALNFLGSGENSEGIHIAWMTALILGVWTILTVAAGVGSGNSFFDAVNGYFPLIGTGMYIVMTLFILMGTVGAVSRQAGGM